MDEKKLGESKDINDISSKLMKNIEDGLTLINVDIGDVENYKEKKMDKEELEKRYEEATRNLKIDTSFIEQVYSDIQEKEHKNFENETKINDQKEKNSTEENNVKDNNIDLKEDKEDKENREDKENKEDKENSIQKTYREEQEEQYDESAEIVSVLDGTIKEDDLEEDDSKEDDSKEDTIEDSFENFIEKDNIENEDGLLQYEEVLERELGDNLEKDNLEKDNLKQYNQEQIYDQIEDEEIVEKNSNPLLEKVNRFGNRIGAYFERRRRKKTHNAAMSKVLVAVTCVFMSLIIYIVYYILIDSKDRLNNPYNERSILMEENVLRGSIYSADKRILAETIEENGEWKRYYPYGSLFAHVVGRYSKGKTGIELGNDYDLLSTSDTQVQKIINDINDNKSPGNSIITTLDYGLQKIASQALNGRKGAVVAIEPSTGKILAMVSKPDYDPNYIEDNWGKYTNADNSQNTLINRATQGLYPPGSTFKIVTALEYMREYNYKEYSYKCVGIQTFDGHNTRCYNTKVHGKEDFITSFANSCNTSFAYMGTLLNISKFNSTCKGLLFNEKLPYDYTYKESSFKLINGSKTTLKVDTAIGQGKTLMTPLHNAMITCAVANKGILMKPYVVDRLVTEDMDVKSVTQPKKAAKMMSESEATILTTMMEEVVNSGTAKKLKNNNYTAAGKTGSAEFDNSNKSHAWFVGFAPATNPKIAVSIIVEEAGTGGVYAVPIAKKMFDEYLNGGN